MSKASYDMASLSCIALQSNSIMCLFAAGNSLQFTKRKVRSEYPSVLVDSLKVGQLQLTLMSFNCHTLVIFPTVEYKA